MNGSLKPTDTEEEKDQTLNYSDIEVKKDKYLNPADIVDIND